MFAFLTVLAFLSILCLIISIVVGLSELGAYSPAEEILKGCGLLFIISLVILIFCLNYDIQNRWVKLNEASDYTLTTIVYTDVKTKNESQERQIKLTYQDINNDIDIESIFGTNYVDKLNEPTTRIYINITESAIRGTRAHVWLKYKQGGKYFWKLMHQVDA
jgi:hypothetical protein